MDLKRIINNKVIKAGSWYTVTELFLKGIAFLTIPIFTRLLSTTDYGLASLYTTWVGIFTIIIGLNLNASITKGKYDFRENYDEFVSSIIFLSLLIFLGYLFVSLMFRTRIQSITGFNGMIFYFMLFHAYFDFIRKSLITKFRVEYNYKKISLISIIISILGVLLSIFFIIFVFKTNPYIGKILGNGILIIIFGIIFLFYFLRNSKGNLVNLKYWKYALSFSVPLIFASLSGLVNAQFDRIIINRYIGASATGLYSFAYNIGMIMAVLTYAFDQAWAPWVYETMENRDFIKIKEKGEIYRSIYTVFYAILLFISPELIKIMANQNYWESLVILPYIFAGYYLSYMYTLEVKTEFFYRKTNLISIGTIFSAAINITLNLVFVPKFGYIAAAATTTISYLFLFAFHYMITSKVIKKAVYGLNFHVVSLISVVIISMYYVFFVNVFFARVIGIFLMLSFGYLNLKNKKVI